MVKKLQQSSGGESTSCNSGGSSPDNSKLYKGVRKRKWGKYVSEIRLPNSRERIWLGSYDTPEKAARAFDAAQFCLRGRSANFNFPDNPPDIAGARSMTPAEIQAAASRFANLQSETEMTQPGNDDNKDGVLAHEVEESSTPMSYSPSISDGATTTTTATNQVESEVGGVERSFYDQLSLATALGSGNYANEYGLFNGFDEFGHGNFYSPQPGNNDNNNFEYGGGGVEEDNYDASFYQESFLWNF